MPDAEPSNRSSLLAAFFLASSWTWVVGMWLPVILVRHFGWPGWVAFAVPNVLGAMSVGLVYRTREASEAFVARRLRTMRAFSKVTLALHAFVLTWALSWLFDGLVNLAGIPAMIPSTAIPTSTVLALATLVGLWVCAAWFGRGSFRAACVAAVAVWALSAALLALSWVTMEGSRALPRSAGDARIVDLLLLAPVLVFGFALCPYLDLTIHRARQQTPGRAGDRAFVLGYGVLFLAMIAGTLLYAQGWIDSWSISFYIAAHLAVQSSFTVSMHLRALRDTAAPVPGSRPARRASSMPLLAGMALGLAPSSALAIRLFSGTPLADLLSFDAIYRVFMACYGLVFPGLLWVWTSSRRDGRSATLVAFATIIAAA
ncbi:MAG: hypothetical protein ACTS27_02985, partial [Phycisphaerales bacterium]